MPLSQPPFPLATVPFANRKKRMTNSPSCMHRVQILRTAILKLLETFPLHSLCIPISSGELLDPNPKTKCTSTFLNLRLVLRQSCTPRRITPDGNLTVGFVRPEMPHDTIPDWCYSCCRTRFYALAARVLFAAPAVPCSTGCTAGTSYHQYPTGARMRET